jgi:hypothetical protein
MKDLTAKLNKYFAAFEAGELDAASCKPRTAALGENRLQLEERAANIRAELSSPLPPPPLPEDLVALGEAVDAALSGEPTPAVKAFLADVIEKIEVTPDDVVVPVLRVPERRSETPNGWTATASGAKTRRSATYLKDRSGFRVQEDSVEVRGIEPRQRHSAANRRGPSRTV